MCVTQFHNFTLRFCHHRHFLYFRTIFHLYAISAISHHRRMGFEWSFWGWIVRITQIHNDILYFKFLSLSTFPRFSANFPFECHFGKSLTIRRQILSGMFGISGMRIDYNIQLVSILNFIVGKVCRLAIDL